MIPLFWYLWNFHIYLGARLYHHPLFCGCYAKDIILNQFHEKYPKVPIRHTRQHISSIRTIILTLRSIWLPCTWKALLTGTYFDSYGILPMHREFAMFMSRNTAK